MGTRGYFFLIKTSVIITGVLGTRYQYMLLPRLNHRLEKYFEVSI